MKMLTIDLLKGKGIPVRSSSNKIALTVVMLEVPLFIAIMMVGCYLHNDVSISIKRQKLVNLEKSINKLSEAMVIQETYEKEKKYANGCLTEVAENINKHTQWTPILIEIVKNVPDSIFLTGIEVKQDSIKKSMPSKNGNGPPVEVSVPVKTLRINVCEKTGFGNGESIRKFQNSLRSSALFGSQLDNIKVSQGIDVVKGQDVVSYQIDCAFKPKF